MAFDLNQSNRKINANIKTIRRRGEELNSLVHETFVLVAIHAQATGDVSGADRLLNALGSGLVKSAPFMIRALMNTTPIQVGRVNGQYHATLAREGSKNFKPYDIDALKANPWWTMDGANDRPPVVWDVDDVVGRLENLAKAINRKIEAGEINVSHKLELELLSKNVEQFARSAGAVVRGEINPKPEAPLPVVEMTDTPADEAELKAVNG